MTNEDEKNRYIYSFFRSLKKLKGIRNQLLIKKGATDLSSKDYILTLIGLFAHQGPQSRWKIWYYL